MARYATIDEYIGALADPLATTARRAREVIDANLDGATSASLETSGEVMAHTKLRVPGDVDEKLFVDWLRQAVELERAQV